MGSTRWAVALLVGLLIGTFASVPCLAAFQVGQSVQVREGDIWSPATVVQREGRRYLVHYANSSSTDDEWVGLDRIRENAAAGSVVAPPNVPDNFATSPPSAPPVSTPPAAPQPVSIEVEPDRTAVAHSQPLQAPGTWSVPFDPAPHPVHAPDSWGIRLRDDSPRMQHVEPRQLLTCSGGGVVLITGDFFNKSDFAERIATKSSHVHAALPLQSVPLAVTPSGKSIILSLKSDNFRTPPVVALCNLIDADTPLTPSLSFVPYQDEMFGEHALAFAVASSETRLITGSRSGEVIAWDVGAHSVTGAWRVDLGNLPSVTEQAEVALSPGGKWIAIASARGITVLDTATGRALGAIPAAGHFMFRLSVSPSGKTLVAALGEGMLISFDLASGKQGRLVAIARNINGPPTAVDDGFALVGGSIVDINTGAAVTPPAAPKDSSVQPASPPPGVMLAATGDGATWLLTATKLLAVHLPTDAAKDAAATAGDSTLALKPGMPVQLDINIDVGDEKRAEVETALRQKLTDDGFNIVPSADTVVLCRTEPGATNQYFLSNGPVILPPFGVPPPNAPTVTLTDKVTRITIQQKGQTIWEQSRTSTPSRWFETKDGQSREDAVRATIQYDPQFLIGVSIPPYIPKPAPAPSSANGQRFRNRRNQHMLQ